MNIITSLLILLAGSRLLGRVSTSLGFSAIIGEVIAGLLLGPVLFNTVTPSKELSGIIELGIFLMIFAAGLEMDLQDIFSAIRKKALLCASIGFTFSFLSGFGLGYLWGLDIFASFILSLCFSITALPIVIHLIRTFNVTDTPMGHTAMGTAVILDVVALLILGVILNIETTDNYVQLIQMISYKTAGLIAFFIVVMLANMFLKSEIIKASKDETLISKLIKRLGDEVIFGAGVVFVLTFSTVTEVLGFHFIIGAFFGGLLLNKDILGVSAFDSMTKTLTAITHQFLTPIFFASIGLSLSLEAFDQPFLLVSIVLVAYTSKIIGSGLGAKWAGFSWRESTQIGITLNCKGILDLIVADIAFSKGYIDSKIFSILIFTGLSSLIINPMLYRQTIPKQPKS